MKKINKCVPSYNWRLYTHASKKDIGPLENPIIVNWIFHPVQCTQNDQKKNIYKQNLYN